MKNEVADVLVTGATGLIGRWLLAALTCLSGVRPAMTGLLAVTLLTWSTSARADSGVGATVSLGMFFEFGDEAGTSGGFELWAGGAYYPRIDHSRADTTGFVAAGLGVRTGLIPVLTGPNEIAPQLRAGLAFTDGHGSVAATDFENMSFPRARIYAIAGYRWVSEFGLDNLDRRRKAENAFRFGVGMVVPWLLAELEAPAPNGADFIVDINRDGSLDRLGFDVVLGF